MVDFSQLEQLIIISKSGTLSKAAEILNVSQPGLTRSMQRLEEELQVQLFDRKKNKITLNEIGKLAVKNAENLIAERNKMIDHLQYYERSRHIINIASCAPAPIWALSYVLQKLYPTQQTSDTLLSSTDELIQGLKEQRYSIIILNQPTRLANHHCEELMKENLFISLPPNHPLAKKKEISFKDLDSHSVLLLSNIGFWADLCKENLPKSHLLFQDNEETFCELAKMSTLPRFKTNITLSRETKSSNWVTIPIANPNAHATYYAVYPQKSSDIFKNIKKEIESINWESLLV